MVPKHSVGFTSSCGPTASTRKDVRNTLFVGQILNVTGNIRTHQKPVAAGEVATARLEQSQETGQSQTAKQDHQTKHNSDSHLHYRCAITKLGCIAHPPRCDCTSKMGAWKTGQARGFLGRLSVRQGLMLTMQEWSCCSLPARSPPHLFKPKQLSQRLQLH